MRCHPTRWLWGLIPIAMLGWIAVHEEADRIELDLEQRSAAALDRAGYDWASVAFSGRDGLVVGTAPSGEVARDAVTLVRRQWGVRVAYGRIRVDEPEADAVPLPAVKSSSEVARATVSHDDALMSGPKISVQTESEAEPKAKPKRELPPITSSLSVLAPEAVAPATRPSLVATSSSAGALVSLAGESLDPAQGAVQIREQEPLRVTQAAADAEMTQDLPQGVALETAALAEVASAAAAETCTGAVRDINFADPVRFGLGKWGLSSHSREILDGFAERIGDCPGMALRVLGHTDARGKAKRNLMLSKRRARAVVTYLIQKGIDAKRLEAVGYGETKPVAPNDTARNMAKNRRIELEITGGSATP